MAADNQLNVKILVDASQLQSGMAGATATVQSASDSIAAALAKVSPAATNMAASLKNAGMSAADAASAMKNLGFSAKEVAAAVGETTVAMNEAGPAAEVAARGVNNARAAMMGLNREIGLGGNRALSTFVAQSQMIGPALSAAFTGIAIVGFIQLANLAGEKLSALIADTYIFTAAQKALYGQLVSDNQAIVRANEEHAKQLRDIAVLGKPLAEQERMRAQWAKEDAEGLAGTIAGTMKQLALEGSILEKKRAARDMIAKDPAAQSVSLRGLDKDIEAQEAKITSLNSTLGVLRARYESAATAAEGMGKKAVIEGIKETEKAAEKAEREQERFQREQEAATHRRIIAELNDEEKAAKEKIKIAEESAKETRDFNLGIDEEIKKADHDIVMNQQKALEQAATAQDKYLRDLARKAKEADKPWQEMFRSITSGMDSMIRGIISGTQSINQAFMRLGSDLLVIMTEALAKILLKHLAHWVAVHIIEKVAVLQSLATLLTGNAAKQAVNSATNAAVVTSDAAVGAAAAFASVMEALPFPANIAAAPGVSAATFAAIESYAPIAAAAGGWNMVPSDNTLALLHKNEMVLPANVADAVRSGAGGGAAGGSIHLHVHANDARSVQDMFRNNSDVILGVIRTAQREFKI